MVLHKGNFPGDIRVENEAIALTEAGHKVFVVCNSGPGYDKDEIFNGIQILRVPLLIGFRRKLELFLFYLLLRNSYWRHILEKLFYKHHFDAFHIHDLPFAGTVLDLGRRFALPVVLDSHENWPIAMQAYRPQSKDFLKAQAVKLAFSLKRWERYERRSFKRADKIISVVPEMKDRIVRLDIPEEKVIVVSNTLNIDHFAGIPIDLTITARYEGRFVISYTGKLARHRHLDTIVKAMPLILAKIPEAMLVVVGEVNKRPELSALVRELGLADAVDLIGWQSFEKIPAYIEASDVGVLPQEPTEHTSNTIPHKLFQYMYLGKAQVVSDCAAVSRIVQETGCGIVCRADLDDVDAWAAAIISLKDPTIRREMGQRGQHAVMNKYNWSVDRQHLINLYENIK